MKIIISCLILAIGFSCVFSAAVVQNTNSQNKNDESDERQLLDILNLMSKIKYNDERWQKLFLNNTDKMRSVLIIILGNGTDQFGGARNDQMIEHMKEMMKMNNRTIPANASNADMIIQHLQDFLKKNQSITPDMQKKLLQILQQKNQTLPPFLQNPTIINTIQDFIKKNQSITPQMQSQLFQFLLSYNQPKPPRMQDKDLMRSIEEYLGTNRSMLAPQSATPPLQFYYAYNPPKQNNPQLPPPQQYQFNSSSQNNSQPPPPPQGQQNMPNMDPMRKNQTGPPQMSPYMNFNQSMPLPPQMQDLFGRNQSFPPRLDNQLMQIMQQTNQSFPKPPPPPMANNTSSNQTDRPRLFDNIFPKFSENYLEKRILNIENEINTRLSEPNSEFKRLIGLNITDYRLPVLKLNENELSKINRGYIEEQLKQLDVPIY